MTAADFAFVAKLLRDRTAIVLEPGKEYLLVSRLTPVAERHGLTTAEQFIDKLRGGAEESVRDLIEAMVTTETLFFRDATPFETLRAAVLPALIAARRDTRRLNIWCAAGSSGQEPYSVALTVAHHFPELAAWDVRILATDISRDMLARSAAGRYSQMEVDRGLPPDLLKRYFHKEGTAWQLADDVRRRVEFRPLNLAQPWPALPTMDLVFLRNVMIYFDVETKKAVLRRAADALAPDGLLVLGGAETPFNLVDCFVRAEDLSAGYYRVVRPLLGGR